MFKGVLDMLTSATKGADFAKTIQIVRKACSILRADFVFKFETLHGRNFLIGNLDFPTMRKKADRP